jgi:hypothetical protein
MVAHVIQIWIVNILHTLQGCKSGISNLPVVPVTPVGSSQSSSVPSSAKISSPISVVQVSLTSSANEIDQHRASEYEDDKLQNCPQVSSHAQSTSNSMHHCAPPLSLEATGQLCMIIRTRLIQVMWNDLE